MPQSPKALSRLEFIGQPIRGGLIFAAFPAKDITPYKYFLLLLNVLQRSCQFELFDIDQSDPFIKDLHASIVDANGARAGLDDFGYRIRKQIALSIEAHDLAAEEPHQIIIIT